MPKIYNIHNFELFFTNNINNQNPPYDELDYCVCNSYEHVMRLIKEIKMPLRYASPTLWSNKEILMAAIKNNTHDFVCASEELKNDKDICLELINIEPLLLFVNIPEKFQHDEDIVFIVVSKNPILYARVPEQFRKNKEITLIALSAMGSLLPLASDELKDDKEVVLAAISSKAFSSPTDTTFVHASKRLRSDPEFVLECLLINPKTFENADHKFHHNRQFLEIFEKNAPQEHKESLFYNKCIETLNILREQEWLENNTTINNNSKSITKF